MPIVNVNLSDAALASSTSGALAVSRGPGAIPVFDVNLNYSTADRVLTLTEGKLFLPNDTVDGSGRIAITLGSHPTLPPFNWVSQTVTQPELDPNIVVSYGHNVGPTGRIDPAKPYFRDAFEGGFWVNYNGPFEYFSERHVGSLSWADGQEIRMLSMICGQTTRKASATFAVSNFSVDTEDHLGLTLGHSWDGTTSHFYLARPGEGHTLDVQGNATVDNLYLGRNGKTTSLIVNGTQPVLRFLENGVEKHSFSSAGGVLYLDGGNLGFFDTPNGKGTLFTQLGVGGGFFNPTAQLDVRPRAANVPGVTVKAFAGQTADLNQTSDSAGVTRVRINKNANLIIKRNSALDDTDLNSSEFSLWLDDTPGGTQLKIKAKDSGGAVRTGEVPLS